MRRLAFLATLASIALAIAACSYDWTLPPGTGGAGGGSSSSSASSTGSSSTGSSSTGSSSTGSSSSGAEAVCPSTAPSAGDPCGSTPLACGYGTDPRPWCRQHFDCKGDWAGGAVGADCGPLGGCTDAQPNGAVCSPSGTFCLSTTNGGASCYCLSGGPPQDHWSCDVGPDATCPSPDFPNLGVSCKVEGAECRYGQCAAGTRVFRLCNKGVWQDEPTGC